MKIKYLLPFLLFFISFDLYAQEISFKDTIAAYNYKKTETNRKGMKVLGTWGVANIVAGGIGYFTAKQDEWKYFHEMNAIWGVANAGIAAISLRNIRKEMTQKMSFGQSYESYRSTKRLYLINSGLDVLYMAVGLGLTKYNTTTKTDQAIFNGFGKSIALQGGFLFIFDNFMYTSHARMNSKWFRIMDEISVSTNGIGIRHNLR